MKRGSEACVDDCLSDSSVGSVAMSKEDFRKSKEEKGTKGSKKSKRDRKERTKEQEQEQEQERTTDQEQLHVGENDKEKEKDDKKSRDSVRRKAKEEQVSSFIYSNNNNSDDIGKIDIMPDNNVINDKNIFKTPNNLIVNRAKISNSNIYDNYDSAKKVSRTNSVTVVESEGGKFTIVSRAKPKKPVSETEIIRDKHGFVTFFIVGKLKPNPFVVVEEIKMLLDRKHINIASGYNSLRVEYANDLEFKKLCNITSLDKCPVRVKPVGALLPTPDIVQLVIVGVPTSMDEETVKINTNCQSAYRIKKNERGVKTSTTAVVLTFDKISAPTEVSLGYLKFKTRPYVREATRCFNCQQFGHVGKHCYKETMCGKCAGGHDTRQCTKTDLITKKCASCDSDEHNTGSVSCPRKIRAISINKSVAREGISYAQAAKKYNAPIPIPRTPLVRPIPAPRNPRNMSIEIPLEELHKKPTAGKNVDDLLSSLNITLKSVLSALNDINAKLTLNNNNAINNNESAVKEVTPVIATFSPIISAIAKIVETLNINKDVKATETTPVTQLDNNADMGTLLGNPQSDKERDDEITEDNDVTMEEVMSKLLNRKY